MSSTNSLDFNYPAFNPLEQHKKSHLVAALLLMVVVVLHVTLVLYLLHAPKTEQKKQPVVMEVMMMRMPGPMAKQAGKESPPAPRPVKKEPIKSKPVIKPPAPVKKPAVVKKPALVPKPKPAEIKKVIPVPKFEPAPALMPAPPVVAPAPTAAAPPASSNARITAKPEATTGQGRDQNKTVVSGAVPLVRVPPKYPARAARRHIEGWVKVEFTIQTDGSVDNAVVVASSPEAVFDDAALTAIGKWKFKEKIVNGIAVPQRALQKLQFKLEQ